MPNKKKFSHLFYNVITYAGVVISVVVATVEFFLFAIDFLNKGKNLYLGLVTYLVLPAVLVLGLILIPVGVLWKKSRIDRGLSTLEFRRFRIDLAIPHHRNALLVFIVGTALLILMSLVGAYKTFHYTESVQFCGVLCHTVMHPEFTTYQKSPHGRVKCVECHIGAGADWYVHSKLSGARQVVKTLANSFERPIHTPVRNLRPAEETCKQCHWPGKYFSTVDFKRTYFLTEGESPEWHLRMLLNVGAGGQQSYGVHAHMNLDKDITYVADDAKRQKISWVKSVDKEGRELVFTSPDSKYKNSDPSPELVRKMDCIDCHNRPSHHFRAPDRLINEAMADGRIDPAVPGIKKKAVELLSKDYPSNDEAKIEIGRLMDEFYKTRYPDFYVSERPKIDQASIGLVQIFSENMFPDMKVRWDTHPDNIGHLNSPGCFRCHDGEHTSLDNRVITKDCNACHRIVEQGPAESLQKNLDGLEFRHPVDIGDDWKAANCSDCHTGGA